MQHHELKQLIRSRYRLTLNGKGIWTSKRRNRREIINTLSLIYEMRTGSKPKKKLLEALLQEVAEEQAEKSRC